MSHNNKQPNITKNNEFIYLGDKNSAIFDQCFQRCCNKKNQFTSLTNKQVTCIKSCTSKLYNAYSFMYHVVLDQGIQRATQREIKQKIIA